VPAPFRFSLPAVSISLELAVDRCLLLDISVLLRRAQAAETHESCCMLNRSVTGLAN
jgi:hypothetical protein